MSSIVIAGDTSGSVTLQAPAVAGSTVIDLPATSGTMALTSGSTAFTNLTVTNGATIQGLTIGRGAGAVATNTAVGASALNANTTGASGVAIGNGALQSNTTASNNTAVGYQAGYTNTTAGQSTYIGTAAGSLATGSGNTFVGCSSGETITTGSSNTILGRYNGNFGGLDIRTASNYIVLSDGAGTPLISTNSSSSVALKGAVPQTGTGITFPATQSASTNANTLDDYEEGTWTPAIGGNATYYAQEGYYTKIGNIVYFYGKIIINVKGTGNNFTMTGFPFNAIYNIRLDVQYWTLLATNVVFLGAVGSGNTQVDFHSTTAAASNVATNTVFGNGTTISFNGFYSV